MLLFLTNKTVGRSIANFVHRVTAYDYFGQNDIDPLVREIRRPKTIINRRHKQERIVTCYALF